jgi:hypothetical protein
VLTKCYTLAERLLCFQLQDEWVAPSVLSFLNYFYFTPTSQALAEQADYTLRIRSRAMMPPIPTGLPQLAITRGHCSMDGEDCYLEIDDSIIHLGPVTSRMVDVGLGQTKLARHPIAINNVMSYAVQGMLRRCNLFTVHAAGVVEPQTDAGALLIGDSNSGKSTLTVRLAASGWRYLTDDALLLYETSSGVEASGYRRFFAISETTLRHLPELEKGIGSTVINDPQKRYLEHSLVFPKSFTQNCQPRAIFFASIVDEERSQLREVSQGDAMMRLISMSPWASLDVAVARSYLRVLERLVRQSKSYDLLGGRDILLEPERARTLLAQCMKS